MKKLLLIKHSLPEIVRGVPAKRWRLSQEGQHRSRLLAEKLKMYCPGIIASSEESKAIETGQIVASHLEKPFKIAEGLHEHDRNNVVFMEDKTQFEQNVSNFFERPNMLVFGNETAKQAQQRFSKALLGLIDKIPDTTLAVVAHGTVITLFVQTIAHIDPFAFWQRLSLPSFVVLSLPELQLENVVEQMVHEGNNLSMARS